MEIGKAFSQLEFERRENALSHTPVEREMRFYECVKRGDLEGARASSTPLGGEGSGVLSTDSLRNLKYHFVITVAFITRFCVEGGMERETAYNLSDLYIRMADNAKTPEEVNEIHSECITDFTERMAKLKKSSSYCYQVIKCMEYIYDHLHERLVVSDIAEELGLSVQYLSKLFHAETGVTLNRYILKKRIDAACQMLKYSDYEAVDIGSFLSFSSHSHFIQKFKQETGLTPKQYRERYYNSLSGIRGGAEMAAE
ncbi:MAG: AraC family transcriptional regulator [Oscillospiraceae bacterium]|nr:AraC family transcriptional regulator [Oscillospiraceae bacterium]